MALIYIAAFVYFGAFFDYPSQGTQEERLRFLDENQLAVSIAYGSIYILFGALLAVMVAGLHDLLSPYGPAASLTSLLGAVWVGLVMASGMIYVTGLQHVVGLLPDSSEAAFHLWRVVSMLGDSLGGGNELVGGLWVAGVSLLGLKYGVLPRALNSLGCLVGAFGLATTLPLDMFTDMFGLSQIVWFLWLGLSLLRMREA
ncbi:Domain protein of unknown function [Congregibacter litoralis]|uniref:DUF4386 family protein n=1 Tax=Congregibacter litoralis KT71 TaxID=314285 RepID=A4A8G5_9GAMM|nr:Domain protein of unknown function [Congregibacter litoralis]EAQ97960.2 Domain protein of unknown function [Congregibacter litoralis KT71]